MKAIAMIANMPTPKIIRLPASKENLGPLSAAVTSCPSTSSCLIGVLKKATMVSLDRRPDLKRTSIKKEAAAIAIKTNTAVASSLVSTKQTIEIGSKSVNVSGSFTA